MNTAKSTGTTKVLGHFRKGTALGDLAQILADRKPHKLSHTLETIRKRHKTTKTWRGYGVIRTVGKTKRAFSITVDRAKDSIQLTGGMKRPAPKKATPKTVTQPAVAA